MKKIALIFSILCSVLAISMGWFSRARSTSIPPWSKPSPPSSQASTPVHPLRFRGIYSNVRVSNATGETHSYGYDLTVYTTGDTLVGEWGVHEGLDGDQPHGPIEKVQWDSATEWLKFELTLNTGVFWEPPDVTTPVRERFEFEGKLTDLALEGRLQRQILNMPENPKRRPTEPPEERIRLPFDRRGTNEWREFWEHEYPTLEAWNAVVERRKAAAPKYAYKKQVVAPSIVESEAVPK